MILGLARIGDTASCAEPRGLVPSRPALRPADILTTASCGRRAALDVCVASPDGAGAGADACASAALRKRYRYREVLDELKAEGYDYLPLVWTSWGRPGPEAQSTLRTLAASAARRLGLADGVALERQAASLIGGQVWRRAAAMVLSCLPSVGDEAPDLMAAAGLIGSQDEDYADDEFECPDQ